MSEQPGRPDIAKGARAWWQALQPDDETGRRGDRAALARLRRAATPSDAMVDEATIDLFRRMGLGGDHQNQLRRVAVVAMVLAHVRADAPPATNGRRPPAVRAVGRATADDPESAKMSTLRFRRLLAGRDDDELAREMRRMVALANRQINVGDLAASLFFWGDKVRTRWAFEYYAAGAAAPHDQAHPADTAAEAAPA